MPRWGASGRRCVHSYHVLRPDKICLKNKCYDSSRYWSAIYCVGVAGDACRPPSRAVVGNTSPTLSHQDAHDPLRLSGRVLPFICATVPHESITTALGGFFARHTRETSPRVPPRAVYLSMLTFRRLHPLRSTASDSTAAVKQSGKDSTISPCRGDYIPCTYTMAGRLSNSSSLNSICSIWWLSCRQSSVSTAAPTHFLLYCIAQQRYRSKRAV